MRSPSLPLLLALSLSPIGCPAPVPPALPRASPTAAPTAAAAPAGDPFAVSGELKLEELPESVPKLPRVERTLPAVAGLAPPPEACKAFGDRKAKWSCSTTGLDALASALEETNPETRDGALQGVESCGGLPPGVTRALRAELAPPECADAIVEPYLAYAPADVDGAVYDALHALALAGKLRRTVGEPPKLAPPHTKKTVNEFVAGPMGQWVTEQARHIQVLAAAGRKLRFYGRAVVALEAGLADLRVVEVFRASPLPEEYAGDEGLRNEYLNNLEAGLDPRKRRGRDAALVALGGLAAVGVIRDPRVRQAREVLTHMYGGRPIDALDDLMLPPLAPAKPASAAERLAARLPTFYAGVLLDPSTAGEPVMLRALMEQGLSVPHRIALRAATPKLTPEARALLVRGRLELAQTYWRAVDVDEVVALAAGFRGARPAHVSLMLGIALALRGGPANAADMMLRAPLSELGVGKDVRALEAVAAGHPELGGQALFDAARVRHIAAPASAGAAYWRELAVRYRAAAARLLDSHDRQRAEHHAVECDAIAAAVEARAKD